MRWLCKPTRSKSSRPLSIRPLRLETLEERAVPDGNAGPAFTTVFIESNNPTQGQNAVIAYRRNESTRELREIGSFLTGGTGYANTTQALGPNDSDQNVIATADGEYLFAVNQGSDTVSSFRIQRNGGLERIGVFSSGGDQPVSLGIAGDHLYVLNRGDSEPGKAGTVAPTLVGFNINPDGRLSPVPGASVRFAVNTSPAQALISPNERFIFVNIFSVPGSTAQDSNTIAPFRINSNGTLTAAPGGAVGATSAAPNLLLGTAHHPDLNIIYAGLTSAGDVGVFSYNEAGRLSFEGRFDDQGAAPCWCVVSSDGDYLYVANTGTNSVGVFSLADPLRPVQIQELALRGPLAPVGDTSGRLGTGAFQITLDPSGRELYVVTQDLSPTRDFANGNQLHTLQIARNGTVSEPSRPVLYSAQQVGAGARVQGVVAVAGSRERREEREERNNRERRLDNLFRALGGQGRPGALAELIVNLLRRREN